MSATNKGRAETGGGWSEGGILRPVTCPLCGGGVLLRRQCKSLCDRCGYVESCEDNFLPQDRRSVASAGDPVSVPGAQHSGRSS
ncbi:MAG: hypothetical protein EDS66_11620 [Planctomycetota bacterium]|nr:MAG: hypothetical protein EDS66_11620 [Planctomycetota bacterium]MCQ3922260.1 hypothetical protein [Planctomycetota bacterium]